MFFLCFDIIANNGKQPWSLKYFQTKTIPLPIPVRPLKIIKVFPRSLETLKKHLRAKLPFQIQWDRHGQGCSPVCPPSLSRPCAKSSSDYHSPHPDHHPWGIAFFRSRIQSSPIYPLIAFSALRCYLQLWWYFHLQINSYFGLREAIV